jgi:hypothetical protein
MLVTFDGRDTQGGAVPAPPPAGAGGSARPAPKMFALPGTSIVEAASHRDGSIIEGAVLGRARVCGTEGGEHAPASTLDAPTMARSRKVDGFPVLAGTHAPRDGDPLAAHARREWLLLRCRSSPPGRGTRTFAELLIDCEEDRNTQGRSRRDAARGEPLSTRVTGGVDGSKSAAERPYRRVSDPS